MLCQACTAAFLRSCLFLPSALSSHSTITS
uniref:Uncharacterized protein n=1 Tax=Anguilla anguilla TaxID=7936 RepID=A0A0E9PRC6_ANGAN